MFKALTPIAAIVIAIGLAVTYVQPSFVAIQAMERETAEYENALRHASTLQALIDEKLERRRSFDQVGLVRLSQLLPTEINEIETILTLDGMARDHDMSLSGIEISASAEAEMVDESMAEPLVDDITGEPIDEVSGGEQGSMTHVDFSFSVTGTYDQLKDFVTDLERSLTLFEITNLSFGESEGDQTSFAFTVRTYAHTRIE